MRYLYRISLCPWSSCDCRCLSSLTPGHRVSRPQDGMYRDERSAPASRTLLWQIYKIQFSIINLKSGHIAICPHLLPCHSEPVSLCVLRIKTIQNLSFDRIHRIYWKIFIKILFIPNPFSCISWLKTLNI